MTESPPSLSSRVPASRAVRPQRGLGSSPKLKKDPASSPGLAFVSRSFMTSVVLRGSDQEFLASRKGKPVCAVLRPLPHKTHKARGQDNSSPVPQVSIAMHCPRLRTAEEEEGAQPGWWLIQGEQGSRGRTRAQSGGAQTGKDGILAQPWGPVFEGPGGGDSRLCSLGFPV